MVGIEAPVWLENQCPGQASSRTSNWMENNILKKLKWTSYSFTVQPVLLLKENSVKHNQNLWMSTTVVCLFLAKKQHHVIGLVEFTLFSDINRTPIKEHSSAGKNSSDGQFRFSFLPFQDTQPKKLSFDVSIFNINVASTKQIPWQLKWNVIGSDQNAGHRREQQ